MRVVHLRQVLAGPKRFLFVIWDATNGKFVEGIEWVVIATDNHTLMRARLEGAVNFFSSQQCVGISSDAGQILERYGVPPPSGWKVYSTAK
jgi:hypothetical protein